MNKNRVVVLTAAIAAIAANYGDRARRSPEGTRAFLELLDRFLAPWDPEQIHEAIAHHLATQPHPPTIADLRQYLERKTIGMPDTAEAVQRIVAAARARGAEFIEQRALLSPEELHLLEEYQTPLRECDPERSVVIRAQLRDAYTMSLNRKLEQGRGETGPFPLPATITPTLPAGTPRPGVCQ